VFFVKVLVGVAAVTVTTGRTVCPLATVMGAGVTVAVVRVPVVMLTVNVSAVLVEVWVIQSSVFVSVTTSG